ncbi:MAG: hypothetical protein V4650_04710 [Pseudomonadota bacterium]
MIWLLKAFAAGFAATLAFHQGLFALFHIAGLVPVPAFNLAPVPPLGVPAVLSLAFFGGLWGPPVAWLIRGDRGARYWLKALVFGAIGPTAVAMLLVFPLKGLAVNPKIVVGALLLNGAWSIGVALCMRLMTVRRRA